MALSWCLEDEAEPETDALLEQIRDAGADGTGPVCPLVVYGKRVPVSIVARPRNQRNLFNKSTGVRRRVGSRAGPAC